MSPATTPEAPARAPTGARSLSPASAPEPAGERAARLVLVLSLLVGALLRLLQYAANRSLWMDEAVLASSVVNRGWAGLFRPLDHAQTAPPGFLLLQKTAVALFGAGEPALRLVPLLAGLAALAAFPAVARRYVSRPAAALAAALFALAPYLVYYSSEAKPYSLDVLVSLAIFAAAAPFLARQAPSRRDAVLLAAAGAAGVWLSQPAAFVLGGAGLALGIPALRARDRPRVRLLAAVGVAWAAGFAGSYALSRASLADAEYMRAFWRSGFLPFPPRSPADLSWLPRAFARAFREPLGVYGEDGSPLAYLGAGAGLAAFATGCVWMARSARGRVALLAAPVALALVASAAGLYPFGGDYTTAGRVLVFLIPSLLLPLAEGVVQTARRFGAAGRAAAVLLAGLALAPSLVYAAVAVPHVRAEVKPLLEYAAENRRPGDVLYVYYRVRPAFDYYAERFGWTGGAVVHGACSRLRPAGYAADLERLRGRGRVWVLFVDGTSERGFDERAFMQEFLDHAGTRLDAQVSHGAWLYLYDLRRGAAGPLRAGAPRFAYDAALDCRGPWAPK